jgi:hypothetical protein
MVFLRVEITKSIQLPIDVTNRIKQNDQWNLHRASLIVQTCVTQTSRGINPNEVVGELKIH